MELKTLLLFLPEDDGEAEGEEDEDEDEPEFFTVLYFWQVSALLHAIPNHLQSDNTNSKAFSFAGVAVAYTVHKYGYDDGRSP